MARHAVHEIDGPTLETLSAGTSIGDALEHMFESRRAPLGIVDEDGLEGVVTYRSIGRALLIAHRVDQSDSLLELPVDIALERSFPQVEPGADLLELFDILADHRYVIISEPEEAYSVVRDVDFHQFLQTELEEFLLIEEIERSIRRIIADEIGSDLRTLLEDTFDPIEDIRTPTDIDECSFRHYSIFISSNWAELDDRFNHRSDFVRELIDRVGALRNRLFHFRDGADPSPLDTDFLEFTREHFYRVQAETETEETE